MRKILLPCLLFLCAPALEAQSADPYRQAVGAHLLLYRGVEYTGAYPNTSGHPFLDSAGFLPGSVDYGGVHYADVLLRYELVRGELILSAPGNRSIVLLPGKIDGFSIRGRRFMHLRTPAADRPAGFFEVLPGGRYLQHQKLWQRGLKGDDPMQFEERKREYAQ